MISMVPLVILVGIARAWKKLVFSGPMPVFWAGRVENVDMFEVEVVENIPFTRVSRGNRVKKKMQFKVRDRVRDFGQKWNKIEMVIPTGMKYRYFIQLNAIESPDISGPQHYILGVKDISFSPQCLGL